MRHGLGEPAAINPGQKGVSKEGVSYVRKVCWEFRVPRELDADEQMAYLTAIFWQLTMPAVKTSLLLFYVRIFPNHRMRMVACITGAILWSFGLASTIVDIDVCTPIRSYWAIPINGHVEGHCVNTHVFYIFVAVMQLLTDIAVLLIPLPFVWRLQISDAKKVALSIIFLLGSLYVSPQIESPHVRY